ncbi:MAG TPA: efflux transporter outer membrane subunit [Candidatus Acidoferrales bacterium]|nr:efflux transporter outer membrane subunit [Candidatus Acidoferrales bacterium]
MSRLLLVSAFALLCGCTVGPNYHRPQVPVPGSFRNAPPPAADSAASLADTKWENLFGDETINQIVTRALARNFDLLIAVERVQEARANLGIVRANQFPFLDANAGLTAVRQSTLGAFTFISPNTNLSATYTSIGVALNWEIDLWGRLRRLTESARAGYLATEEGRRAVEVSLVADVIDSYFQLLEFDSELEISRQTEATARDSVRLVELRHQRGAASALDVRQAEQLVYTATARIAATRRSITQTEDQLSLLQGDVPSAQPRSRKLEDLPGPAQVAAGLPSALLERRPDIRQAEQNLVAANAQIGAARALYYPQIALTASAGGQSRYLLDIATLPARAYTVAPSALQAIFHGGQIRNQVRLSEAQQREMLIAYQRSIYTALREVSDALVALERSREERTEQEHLVATLEDTVRLSDIRYRGGLDSYLQVLDAQRNLFSGQLTLAQLRLAERMAVVQIYRALGGGWS